MSIFDDSASFRSFMAPLLVAISTLTAFSAVGMGSPIIKTITEPVELSWVPAESRNKEACFSTRVSHDGAVSVRLLFGPKFELREGDSIEISASQPNARQLFFSEALRSWNNTSAYFDGSSVTVRFCTQRVNATPPEEIRMEHQPRMKTSTRSLMAPRPRPFFSFGSNIEIKNYLCGDNTDTRSRAKPNHPAVCRIFPAGCTATIGTFTTENGEKKYTLLTAGHCVNKGMQMVQCQVPDSDNQGSPKHPEPQYQFPIIPESVICNAVEKPGGLDWAVFSSAKNADGASIFDVQKQWAVINAPRLPAAIPLPESESECQNETRCTNQSCVSVIGFGEDRDTKTLSYTQQVATGLASSLKGQQQNMFSHTADTTHSNSGSPVIGESGKLIGIHTRGACNSDGSKNANVATAFNNGDFCRAALGLLPDPVSKGCKKCGNLITGGGGGKVSYCSSRFP